MKQKSLSAWLRVICALVMLCTLFLSVMVMPMLGKAVAYDYKELAWLYWPCLIFFWLTAAAVIAFLVLVWLIARDIGRDRSFTLVNARRLGACSVLALADTLLYASAGCVLMAFHLAHFALIVLGVILCAVGAAVSVACAALSHLARKAADMQSENDLTV